MRSLVVVRSAVVAGCAALAFVGRLRPSAAAPPETPSSPATSANPALETAAPAKPGAATNAVPTSAPARRAGAANKGVGVPEFGEIVAKPFATRRAYYGWQIVAIGGTGGLLAGASLVLPKLPFDTLPSVAAFVIGAPTYGLAGPVVHWSRGYLEKGLISFVANIGIPVLAGGVWATLHCGREHVQGCSGDGWARGAALGMVLAPVLDGLILGWEDAPVDYIGHDDRGLPRGGPWAIGPSFLPHVVLGPGPVVGLGVTGLY